MKKRFWFSVIWIVVLLIILGLIYYYRIPYWDTISGVIIVVWFIVGRLESYFSKKGQVKKSFWFTTIAMAVFLALLGVILNYAHGAAIAGIIIALIGFVSVNIDERGKKSS